MSSAVRLSSLLCTTNLPSKRSSSVIAGRVDGQPLRSFLQQSPVACAGAQRTGPLAVALALIREAGQFRLQLLDQRLAMRLLAPGFHRVEADRIAPLPLAPADDDFLDLQILHHLAVAPRPGKDGLGDLVAASHRHRHQVLAAALGERLEVGLRHHAGIAHEHASGELPALSARTDLAEQIKIQIQQPASDSMFSDCLHLPNLGDNPDDQAVLQYAMGREHIAMTHYTELAQTAPEGPIRELFQFLASEETSHKLELEKLYYETVHRGGGV